MSEKQPHIETGPADNEHLRNNEAQTSKVEKLDETKNETLSVEKTREHVQEIHKSTPGTAHAILENDEDNNSTLAQKPDNAKQKLKDIRHVLKPSEKRLSKVIHNPKVSAVSEATAKTVARPYAVLSGGLVACVGSGLYVYYTRHLGYSYNFFVPILLFGLGLAVGLAVEMLFKAVHRGRKKRNS